MVAGALDDQLRKRRFLRTAFSQAMQNSLPCGWSITTWPRETLPVALLPRHSRVRGNVLDLFGPDERYPLTAFHLRVGEPRRVLRHGRGPRGCGQDLGGRYSGDSHDGRTLHFRAGT